MICNSRTETKNDRNMCFMSISSNRNTKFGIQIQFRIIHPEIINRVKRTNRKSNFLNPTKNFNPNFISKQRLPSGRLSLASHTRWKPNFINKTSIPSDPIGVNHQQKSSQSKPHWQMKKRVLFKENAICRKKVSHK